MVSIGYLCWCGKVFVEIEKDVKHGCIKMGIRPMEPLLRLAAKTCDT